MIFNRFYSICIYLGLFSLPLLEAGPGFSSLKTNAPKKSASDAQFVSNIHNPPKNTKAPIVTALILVGGIAGLVYVVNHKDQILSRLPLFPFKR